VCSYDCLWSLAVLLVYAATATSRTGIQSVMGFFTGLADKVSD